MRQFPNVDISLNISSWGTVCQNLLITTYKTMHVHNIYQMFRDMLNKPLKIILFIYLH